MSSFPTGKSRDESAAATDLDMAFEVLDQAERFVAKIEGPEDYALAPAIATARGEFRRELADVQAQHDRLLRFVDAVSPFVRDVLDEPFPWQHGGQVTCWMTREEYDEALAALEALRD